MHHPEPTPGDTAWFTHDRFGLFIHWGLYSLGARHEWLQNREELTVEDYRRYFEHFDPDLFNPRQWAKAAREAGMKYFVVTTKHHEGFCLWDTQFTDYKAPNTPAGRDLLREIVDAFREEGLRVGLYYSLIDWHHPDFPIDQYHPQRNHSGALQQNASRDMKRYSAYMRNQVRELLTNYGPIDILWFDFSYPEPDPKYPQFSGKGHVDYESESLLAMVRELVPRIIVNNRLDLHSEMADVHTPEQYQPADWFQVDGRPVVWEGCQTLSGSWGYHRDEMTWKSPSQLIGLLVDSVSKGGNLLMNVGPTARGVLDHRALAALQVYADWMAVHERSIRGCTQSQFSPPSNVLYTENPATGRLYAHLFSYPYRHLHLPGLVGRVQYAQFLHDASELPLNTSPWLHAGFQESLGNESLTLEIPIRPPAVEVPVIELFLK